MSTDWLTVSGVLLAGLIAGALFVRANLRRDRRLPAPDVDRRDLEAKRDALVQQLRDIDDGDPAAPEERRRLEKEAAEVLRALDAQPGAAKAAVSEPAPARSAGSGESTLKGFLWGAGTVSALVLVGYLAMRTATPREENTAMAPQAQTAAPSLEQLEAAVQRNPDDADARVELARAYLERENLLGVFEQTQAVLQKTPNDPRAQTYQAIVRVAMGQGAEARRLLDAATRHDPSLADAWVALAWLNTSEGKGEAAEAAIREAIRKNPAEEGRLNEILAQMRSQASGGAPPPSAAPAAPSVPAPAAGPSVRIVLQLDPAARPPQNGVIFIIARASGVTSGPPAAAKRIPLGAFPLNVDLSGADSMMGQPLPETMRIEARIDSDGVATTRSAGEPTGAADGVRIGQSTVVVLK